MTFEEYLQFLEEYWDLFGPIAEKKLDPKCFENMRL
jgi:hypothetical protein